MWVESEPAKGSKFFFTITSQIAQTSKESTVTKMMPFAKRTILYMDTFGDQTGVAGLITELGLRVHVAQNVSQVAKKDSLPHIDTIAVDSFAVVRISFFSLDFSQTFLW